MHVLFVVHNFLPHHRAGVEAYTQQVAKALAGSMRVTIATTRKVISLPTGTIRTYRHDGLEVLEVINNLDFGTLDETFANATMERAFAEVLKRTAPDLVHFQHLLYWSLGAPRMAKQQGLPTVATLHDYFLMCARMGQMIDFRGALCELPDVDRCAQCMAQTSFGQSARAARWIRRLCAVRKRTGIALDRPLRWMNHVLAGVRRPRGNTSPVANTAAASERWRDAFGRRDAACRATQDSIDRFLTPSVTLREAFVRWGFRAEQIQHLPQGLDHAPFRGVERSHGRRLRLAFLGTIAPHKGLDVLIRAVRQLPAERVELSVFGPKTNAAYAKRCAELAAEAEHIRLHGALARSAIPGAYRDIDVLCVPSLWNECCPLTIQEGYLAGVPSVVSGIGGMAELVDDGENGLHARPGDVDDWVCALRRLIDDPDLRDRFAARLPAVPTIDEHVAGLTEVYVQVGAQR